MGIILTLKVQSPETGIVNVQHFSDSLKVEEGPGFELEGVIIITTHFYLVLQCVRHCSRCLDDSDSFDLNSILTREILLLSSC